MQIKRKLPPKQAFLEEAVTSLGLYDGSEEAVALLGLACRRRLSLGLYDGSEERQLRGGCCLLLLVLKSRK
jgi:hypothetical protein